MLWIVAGVRPIRGGASYLNQRTLDTGQAEGAGVKRAGTRALASGVPWAPASIYPGRCERISAAAG